MLFSLNYNNFKIINVHNLVFSTVYDYNFRVRETLISFFFAVIYISKPLKRNATSGTNRESYGN
jgi:hypothetical protein